MKGSSIYSLINDLSYRERMLDSLSTKITRSSDIRQEFEYLFDNKLDLFRDEIFMKNLYTVEDVDNYTDIFVSLVLIPIRFIYIKIFQNIPDVFNSEKNSLLISKNGRSTRDIQLELLQLSFNIDEIVDYLLEMKPYYKSLEGFINLGRTEETAKLLSDNYLALLINRVKNTSDIESEIQSLKRDLNIKNILK